MESYKPTRKEIAYIAGVNDISLQNWLSREVVTLDSEREGRRWNRFSFFNGLKIALVGECTKYGINAQVANGMVNSILNQLSCVDGELIELRRINVGAKGIKSFPLSDDPRHQDAKDFLSALATYKWVIHCELEQSGPSINPSYRPQLVREDLADLAVDEKLQSYIVIKFAPIIERVLTRWDEIQKLKQGKGEE